MRDKVINIIVKELEVEPAKVSESSGLDGLGVDSPHLLEIALAIEEEFGFEVPDADLARFRVVGDVVTYVKEHAM